MTRAFFESVAPLCHVSMGTEVAAQLLYALVRFTRPERLLEVGAGYTTLFILQALADNAASRCADIQRLAGRDAETQRDDILLNDYFARPYQPFLISIDDLSHPRNTAGLVPDIAASLSLSTYLRLYHAGYEEILPQLMREDRPFDFAWLDCGRYANYMDFLSTVWPCMNDDGGIFVLHSTETNFEAQAFIRKMKIKQATTEFENFELCSLREPHKRRQNSLSVFRITRRLSEPFYSARP